MLFKVSRTSLEFNEVYDVPDPAAIRINGEWYMSFHTLRDFQKWLLGLGAEILIRPTKFLDQNLDSIADFEAVIYEDEETR